MTYEKIKQIANRAGLDISKYKPDQIVRGYSVEKEHDTNDEIDVVKNPADLIKVSIAHLREFPNYYTRLKKVEDSGTKKSKNENFDTIDEAIPVQAKQQINVLLKSYKGKKIPDKLVHNIATQFNVGASSIESYIYSIASEHLNEGSYAKRKIEFHDSIYVFTQKKRVRFLIETEKAIGFVPYSYWSNVNNFKMWAGSSSDVLWFPKGTYKIDLNQIEYINKKIERYYPKSKQPIVIMVIKEQGTYLLVSENEKDTFSRNINPGHIPIKQYVNDDYLQKAVDAGRIFRNENKQITMNIKQIIEEEVNKHLLIKEGMSFRKKDTEKDRWKKGNIVKRENSFSGWFDKKPNQEAVYATGGNKNKLMKLFNDAVQNGEMQVSEAFMKKLEMTLSTARDDMKRIYAVINYALRGQGLGAA